MTKQIASSMYSDYAHAKAAVERVESAGISSANIRIFTNEGQGSRTDGTPETLAREGVPPEVAHSYVEGVRRGGAVVAVRCNDDAEAERVVRLLSERGTVDLDEREAQWRRDGWRGYEAGTGATGATSARAAEGGEEVIPIAEESLHVDKREARHGHVRVHSHVVEQPVQEQVTLRDEHVEIERRPADRAVAGDGDPFRERTIDVEERSEEAVVSKEARVREELVVRKDVDQHTETVSDTVRRTEVEVEDDRGTRTPGATDRRR